MHYDGEFRREEATPSRLREALKSVRVDWMEHGSNSTPPPCWTGRGSFGGARGCSCITFLKDDNIRQFDSVRLSNEQVDRHC